MVYGNKCLDATGQWHRQRHPPRFTWDRNGAGQPAMERQFTGTITGVQSGLCVDASANGTANGTLLHLWACHGGTNQQREPTADRAQAADVTADGQPAP